jgi:hypothetical protein
LSRLAHHPDKYLLALEMMGEKTLMFSFTLERGSPKYVCGKNP